MTWVVRQRMFAGPLFCCLRSCSLYLRQWAMVVYPWYTYIYGFYMLPEVTWSVPQATDEWHKAGMYRTVAEIYAFRLLQIRPLRRATPSRARLRACLLPMSLYARRNLFPDFMKFSRILAPKSDKFQLHNRPQSALQPRFCQIAA